MTNKSGERENREPQKVELGREDQAFVEHMRAEFRASERSEAENAAFDARLSERLQEGRGRLVWQGGAVAAAVAAALVLFVVTGTELETSDPVAVNLPPIARTEIAPAAEVGGIEGGVEFSTEVVEDALVALAYGYAYEDDGLEEDDTNDFNESLPNDYVAIGSLFLGG